MKKIEIAVGYTVQSAAQDLVANAPAWCEFNGITLKAQSSDDDPKTIVNMYHAECAERGRRYRESPEGKAAAAKQEAIRQRMQEHADRHMRHLQELRFDDCDFVLAWVGRMCDITDCVDVHVNKAQIIITFVSNGWGVGVNCHEEFDGNDERNFAGWIVGQWLDSWHPIVGKFIDDWLAKFRGGSKRAVEDWG